VLALSSEPLEVARLGTLARRLGTACAMVRGDRERD
jgi:hypothetical protein